MSNGEGISESTVRNMIANEVSHIKSEMRDLRSEQNNLDREMSNLVNVLERSLQELNRNMSGLSSSFSELKNVSEGITRAVENVKSAVEDMKQSNAEKTAELIEELKETSETTRLGLEKVEDTTKYGLDNVREAAQTGLSSVVQETQRGTENIAEKVKFGTETTIEGLKKVSSGVAFSEIVSSKFTAGQSDFAIKGVIHRIEERYSQAIKHIIKIKEQFDGYYKDTLDGFDNQLNVIGGHIHQLEETVFRDIHDLEIAYNQDYKYLREISESEKTRISRRQEIINREYDRLNLEELKKFEQLFKDIMDFLEDGSIISKEIASQEEFDSVKDSVWCLPLNVVLNSEDKNLDTYCLEMNVNSGKNEPRLKPELHAAGEKISRIKLEINTDEGKEISEDEQQELINSMFRLKDQGLIEPKYFNLIIEHMKIFKLKRFGVE